MFHKAERALGGAEALARISLRVSQCIADEMVVRDHPKISEAPDILERGFSADVEDGFREFDFECLATASIPLLLVTPVDSQQHIRTRERRSPRGEHALSVSEIRAVGRLGCKIERDSMLDALLFTELRGETFDT